MAEDGPGQVPAVALLTWYDVNARSLPWRARAPRRPDPYHVWLSEIMLQQTTVAAVKDYFTHFVARWPTVEALAAAPRDDILSAWAGLGYYARARNLHACAIAVVTDHGGQFPRSSEGLRSLPGIGPYTAAAIAAIAYDEPAAAVDGNVERVVTRLFAIETPLPAAKPQIRKLAQDLVPERRAGDFAQAMMDLGATICTPRSPACMACPLQLFCKGLKQGLAATLPRKLPRKAVPLRKGHAYWIARNDHVLLRRRPDQGLLGGMLEVPGSDWKTALSRDAESHAPVSARWRKLRGKVEHTFTHFSLQVTVLVAEDFDGVLPADGSDWIWQPVALLGEVALPTVMRKIAAHALGGVGWHKKKQ